MQFLIRRTALSLAIAAASSLGMTAITPIAMAAQMATYNFDVAPGPLDQSLTLFADQAGLRLLVSSELLEGRKSAGLQGRFGMSEGVTQLLQGTGLEATVSGDMLLVEQAAQAGRPLELGSTVIQGQGMGQVTENSGSYTTGLTSVGSKTPTSIRQTPQSVSVVTAQLIEDQHMTDLSEAMKMTPGITVQKSNYRLSQFYSRGFKIENIQIDGAAPMALGTTSGSFYSNKTYDLAEFDHVEILRGSSGLFGGTGDPGGIINLVRKRPLDHFQLNVESAAGSWDNYRQQVDVTGPLAFDGKLRGRLVASYTDRQTFQDYQSTEKPLVYGVLEADITPSTMLTLGGRYERIHENGTGGDLPRYSTGADLGLKRSTNLTTDWAFLDGRSQEIFAKVDHDLSEDWHVNVTYTQTQEGGYSKVAAPFGAIDPTTLTGSTWTGSSSAYQSEQNLWDVNLSGKFDLFGQTHELIVGADYQNIESRWQGHNDFPGQGGPVNVFDPASTPWAYEPTTKNWVNDYHPNSQTQYGLYSTLRLRLADPLHLIVGARAQRYKFHQVFEYNTPDVQERAEVRMREPTKVVPFGGVVYDLNDQWSTYASYSEIFKPQQNMQAGPLPGSSIEPMTGKTYEIGIKGELLEGRVNTSAALYYTTRENEAISDPNYPWTSTAFGGSCCYLTQGKVISKGIDLEVSGELMPDWMLIAGYSYNYNKNRTENASFSSITPKHSGKLWSTYKFSGSLSDLTVGGGVNIQSATYVSGTANRLDGQGNVVVNADGFAVGVPYKYSQSGYAIWSAMAKYQLDDHWSLTYNLNNAFDKTYYQTVGSSLFGNYYGEPRNHMFTLRGEFW
ncbi:TonB-dependent siderophore receptor [Pseudomonas alabamensis]|uniref:TonB-dependent siderophore receptor n=1 Tax=Pseudomonas alabamensis TaxID=3064349 RepID=UPI003F653C6E